MTYTTPWNSGRPPVGTAADTIGIEFRLFRDDVADRLESLLKVGTDLDTDPLQLRADITGAQTDHHLWIGPHQFVCDSTAPVRGDNYVEISSSAPLLASPPLPPGYTLKQIIAYVDKPGVGTLTLRATRTQVATRVESQFHANVSITSTGYTIVQMDPINVTLIDGEISTLKLSSTSFTPVKLYGVLLFVDRDGSYQSN